MAKTYLLQNSNGPVVYKDKQWELNEIEYNCVNNLRAEAARRMSNDLGVDIAVTSLSAILKDISEQKFYSIKNLSDYIPFNVGEGAWAKEIVSYRAYDFGTDFEDGFIDEATADSKLSTGTTGMDAVHQKVHNWAKKIGFNLFELKQAGFTGNYDLQARQVKSLKKNFDLGLQERVFKGDKRGPGLLNQKGVTTNTSLITKPLSSMTATEFNNFIGTVPAAYAANAADSEDANVFLIPKSDYLGLVNYASAEYQNRTKIDTLREAFKVAFQDDNFKVLPCAYANAGKNGLAGNKNIYALYKADADCLRVNVPVPFSMLQVSSINGFNFEGVGIAQVADVSLLQPKTLMYFTCSIA